MHPFHHAAAEPQRAAIVMASTGETMSYRALEDRSNRAAQLFRHLGLKRGDTLAILMTNRMDYLPLCWGAQRAGLVFTCISTKLTAAEAGYIVKDCGARLVVADAALAEVASALPPVAHLYAVGGPIDGFEDWNAALDAMEPTRIADESPGRDMLYSSGTTGRPKGISGPLPEGAIDQPDALTGLVAMLFGFRPAMVYLSPAPLYHAAPLRYCLAVHKLGGTVVVMEKFDPEAWLRLVSQHRVTHTQMVPTMFVRLLKLSEDARAAADLSSLEAVIHAAAPCPIEVKQRMIDWLGPRIFEYYSATEGAGFTAITSAEWLERKGSVGRSLLGEIRVLGEEGQPLPPGETGRIFFHGGPPVAYHNDPEQTAEVQGPHGATFGDIGHVDEEGYLWLTDRASYMIISGGVNVYPQETEDCLITHPRVMDVAVIGVPDDEMGEAVKAVVQPLDGADAGPELEAELIAWVRARLSHVKCPRSVDFVQQLPRHDTGKLYKRLLRDRYWPAEAGARA